MVKAIRNGFRLLSQHRFGGASLPVAEVAGSAEVGLNNPLVDSLVGAAGGDKIQDGKGSAAAR